MQRGARVEGRVSRGRKIPVSLAARATSPFGLVWKLLIFDHWGLFRISDFEFSILFTLGGNVLDFTETFRYERKVFEFEKARRT